MNLNGVDSSRVFFHGGPIQRQIHHTNPVQADGERLMLWSSKSKPHVNDVLPIGPDRADMFPDSRKRHSSGPRPKHPTKKATAISAPGCSRTDLWSKARKLLLAPHPQNRTHEHPAAGPDLRLSTRSPCLMASSRIPNVAPDVWRAFLLFPRRPVP